MDVFTNYFWFDLENELLGVNADNELLGVNADNVLLGVNIGNESLWLLLDNLLNFKLELLQL